MRAAETARGFALSNPTELINLTPIAEPGIGPAAGRIADRNLRACGEPELDPYSSLIDPADGSGRERRSGMCAWEL
jgi:hypothetical protein